MTMQEIRRKLTAILSADVKGYSRLMGEDEEGTLRTLNTYKEVLGSFIQQYRGRIVGTAGDSVLAEFASVVDAVQCAVEIQQVLRAKNAMVPENRRMEFRIGINLGDVIEEGDSIYGDGVNIAARLEGLAEAGGICISESAYQQIENKLPLRYQYLGEHQVKNISKPVRAYRAQIEPEAATEKKTKPRQWQMAAIGLVIGVIAVVVAIALWNFYTPSVPRPEVTLKEKVVTPPPEKAPPPAPPSAEVAPKEKSVPPSPKKVPKPAALPVPKIEVPDKSVRSVNDIRRDEEQRKTLEEMTKKTEEALREIEKLKKEMQKDEGEKVTQEKYAKAVNELNATERKAWEEMTKKTEEALKEIEKLKKEIQKGEGEKVTQEKYAKAVNELNATEWFKKGFTLRYVDKNNQEAMKAFDKAIEIDPNYAKAYAQRAVIYADWRQFLKALKESEQAIKLDPNLAWGFNSRGVAHTGLMNYQEAIQDFNKALELEPRYAWPYCNRSWANLMLRNYPRAVEDASKAIELAPEFSMAYFRRGRALASLNNFQDAIDD